jgi:hypothetical protein
MKVKSSKRAPIANSCKEMQNCRKEFRKKSDNMNIEIVYKANM